MIHSQYGLKSAPGTLVLAAFCGRYALVEQSTYGDMLRAGSLLPLIRIHVVQYHENNTHPKLFSCELEVGPSLGKLL
jgi:hypothetical protein